MLFQLYLFYLTENRIVGPFVNKEFIPKNFAAWFLTLMRVSRATGCGSRHYRIFIMTFKSRVLQAINLPRFFITTFGFTFLDPRAALQHGCTDYITSYMLITSLLSY